jgi:hypothetical protein
MEGDLVTVDEERSAGMHLSETRKHGPMIATRSVCRRGVIRR